MGRPAASSDIVALAKQCSAVATAYPARTPRRAWILAKTIFINYRRDDSEGDSGRLHDRVAWHAGKKNVFWDRDDLGPGEDFVDKVAATAAEMDIVLAVIGPNGRRRRIKGASTTPMIGCGENSRQAFGRHRLKSCRCW